MTPKERVAMQQALEALEGGLWDYGPGQDEHDKCNEVTTALREALAEQEEQEPVAWGSTSETGEVLDCVSNRSKTKYTHAWIDFDLPLYAAPVRTKDLTDALKHYADTYCEGWCKETGGTFEDCGGCKARSVISADREKNK